MNRWCINLNGYALGWLNSRFIARFHHNFPLTFIFSSWIYKDKHIWLKSQLICCSEFNKFDGSFHANFAVTFIFPLSLCCHNNVHFSRPEKLRRSKTVRESLGIKGPHLCSPFNVSIPCWDVRTASRGSKLVPHDAERR